MEQSPSKSIRKQRRLERPFGSPYRNGVNLRIRITRTVTFPPRIWQFVTTASSLEGATLLL